MTSFLENVFISVHFITYLVQVLTFKKTSRIPMFKSGKFDDQNHSDLRVS